MPERLEILLIEDNPGDALLFKEILQESSKQTYAVRQAATMADALAQLDDTRVAEASKRVDLMLVDLNLPDSQGLNTVETLIQRASDIPLIVLTGAMEENLAIQAMRLGAQDYLLKDEMHQQLLVRSITYALERHALYRTLFRLWEREKGQLEIDSLNHLSSLNYASVTSALLNQVSLSEGFGKHFEEMVHSFGEILEMAVERHLYKTQHVLSTRLQQLADTLGFYNAGPRDVIDVYRVALTKAIEGLSNSSVYVQEGRLVALELMGYLVSFYRRYAIGPNIRP